MSSNQKTTPKIVGVNLNFSKLTSSESMSKLDSKNSMLQESPNNSIMLQASPNFGKRGSNTNSSDQNKLKKSPKVTKVLKQRMKELE